VVLDRRHRDAGRHRPPELDALVFRAEGRLHHEDDIDSFQFQSEPKLRDWIRIELKNQSDKLELVWRILDASRSPVHGWRGAEAGADVSDEFVASPASEYFVQVASQFHSTEGAYILSVAPQRRFDRYEPNDSMQAAASISLAQTVTANIMDPKDIDSYRFTASPGIITISLQNESATLEPSVRVLDALGAVVMDWRANGNPGGHLSPSVELKAAGTYYVEVGSHFGTTAGAYQLLIK
jgi:hypothetical protein